MSGEVAPVGSGFPMVALTHWACFLIFFKRASDVLAPHLGVIFQLLLHLDSFPACWRLTNVIPILNRQPSSSVDN